MTAVSRVVAVNVQLTLISGQVTRVWNGDALKSRLKQKGKIGP